MATANPNFETQHKAFESLNKIQWTCVVSEFFQVGMGVAMAVSFFLASPRSGTPTFLFEGERLSFSLAVLYLITSIFAHTVVYSIASGLDDAFSKNVGIRLRRGLLPWLGAHTVLAGISVPIYFSQIAMPVRILPSLAAVVLGIALAVHVRKLARGVRLYLEEYLTHALRVVDPS